MRNRMSGSRVWVLQGLPRDFPGLARSRQGCEGSRQGCELLTQLLKPSWLSGNKGTLVTSAMVGGASGKVTPASSHRTGC